MKNLRMDLHLRLVVRHGKHVNLFGQVCVGFLDFALAFETGSGYENAVDICGSPL